MARPEGLPPPSMYITPCVPAWARPTHVPRRATPHRPWRAARLPPSLVGRLDDLFNTPVGHEPEERDGNIEHDRNPRLNKGHQNRRGIDREGKLGFQIASDGARQS